MRYALLLPLLLLLALPVRAQEDTQKPDIYVVVEDPPELVGGIEALAAQVRYPEAARAAGEEGNVYVQFVVNEEGRVQDAEVVKGTSPALDAEALRVVQLAEFRPGRHQGEPVKVLFTLPVRFELSEQDG